MKSLFPARIGTIPPSETLTPSTQKQKTRKFPKENFDPNVAPPDSSHFKSPANSGKSPAAQSKSPLPPRPPSSSNRLKRKFSLETLAEDGCASLPLSDCGVQVIVRVRPISKEEEGVRIVQQTSPNSISILEHSFAFDSVADERSTQDDIFQLVGLPLVENCLAGFNSSIFAYGQTGSGKTYTMWGTPNSLTTDCALNLERGLTPRVFEQLFFRINEEQAKHSDMQLHFQCHCSFLEIYNEQITDLFDPSQKNLQVREDVKTGIYVDCLKQEYVSSTNDVFQLLKKGLANRKIGATSMNIESSRSHCVFTCIVECRSKNMKNGLISLRTSRINLVDLAGSERQKATGAAGERLKEAGGINRSLSQLGSLINILAEVSQSGKHRHIPYRDSRLTFLLQESLGGNAKLAMICNISPSKSCKSETLSTLRFAQRAKAIRNKAIVNETMEDDANVLREQIRRLKDELLRMKTNGGKSEESNGSCSIGRNVRRSLSLLRFSLCRPRTLPIEDDSDEEMEIVQEGVETFATEAQLPTLDEGNSNMNEEPTKFESSKEQNHSDNETFIGDKCFKKIPDISSECYGGSESGNRPEEDTLRMSEHSKERDESKMIPAKRKSFAGDPAEIAEGLSLIAEVPSNEKFLDCLSIVASEISPVQSPATSISSRTVNYSRKSPRTSSSISASQKSIKSEVERDSDIVNVSFSGFLNKSRSNMSSIDSSNYSHTTTENLARVPKPCSSLENSSFRFSSKPVDTKLIIISDKVDACTQTLSEESNRVEDATVFICNYCKRKALPLENNDITEKSELQIVLVDGSESSKKPQPAERGKKQVPKAMEKVLAGAIRREMALEDRCSKQAAEIMHLNRLVQQYKHERECREIIERAHEDKISRLEGLMDGVMPTEEFMEKEFLSLRNEFMILKEKYENHPEVLQLNIELKKTQNELDNYRNFFNMGEKDVLLEEIQDLRYYLQCYVDSTSTSNRPLLQLSHSMGSILAPAGPPAKITDEKDVSVNENFEPRIRNWTDLENEWVSLYKGLKTELETCQSLIEKQKLDLESEKKYSEELNNAFQSALQVHTKTLEQYADLEEKHMALLQKHRKMREGILDAKKQEVGVGVKCDTKSIKSISAQIETLREDRERKRMYRRDENEGLQTQLRDTSDAVLAPGELLTRLKEAEDAAANAKTHALLAEQKTEKAYQEIDELKKKYESQIVTLNELLAESHSAKDRRVDEFSAETRQNSWLYAYDQCNI